MKKKLIISNLVFAIALFFMIGGGDYANYGYVLLAAYLVLITIMFPNELFATFFSKGSTFLYLFLLYIACTSSFNINTCIATFTMFMPCMLIHTKLSILDNKESCKRQEKTFFFIILFIFLFYCYKSFELLKANPMALRLLISTEKDDSIVVGGGYALPYSLTILCPALVLNIQNVYSKANRIVIYSFIVIGSFLVVSSMFTTAILLLFAGFMYVFFKKIGKDKKITAIICMSIAVVLILFLFPMVKDYFLSQDANVVGRRLVEIDNILKGNKGEDEGDFLSRIELSLSSLKTFLSAPIIGIGPSVRYDYFEMEKLGVGSHSQWFDIFAIYGLFSVLLLSYLRKTAKGISKDNVALTLFILLGFLNPIFFFNLIFVTYYITPMFNYLWPSRNEKDK